MRIFQWPADEKRIAAFFERAESADEKVERSVRDIIADVRRDGDKALVRYSRKFDGITLRPSEFEVPAAALEAAWASLPRGLRSALKLAEKRIREFHRRQKLRGWTVTDPGFGRMELRVEPIQRVGVYVPGGSAPLPSTVLMTVVPAKVAGVDEIILMTPPGPGGMPSPAILGAAHLAGATRVFRAGGAQAVAALAHGTETIPRADKIVGPGNIYVATAKRLLFGTVDIDSVAGPSEVLILADRTARPDWIAADMLAQAEHDPDASAGVILIGGGKRRASEIRDEVARQLERLERKEIASASIRDHGFMILVRSEREAAELADRKAPEHIEILTARPRELAKRIRHAGAIFIGPHSPEALGDYVAGPNHTLPTAGTARFFSPLSVWSYYRTCHTIEATPRGLAGLSGAIQTLAHAEGLTAHAESARIRGDKPRVRRARR